MSAIQDFQKAKAELNHLKAWASLIGKEYHGGGGGVGSVVHATARLTIYHQEHNGAPNYHEAASGLDFINRAIKEKAGAIIGHAIYLAEMDLQELAKKAKAEADEVIAVLGTTP